MRKINICISTSTRDSSDKILTCFLLGSIQSAVKQNIITALKKQTFNEPHILNTDKRSHKQGGAQQGNNYHCWLPQVPNNCYPTALVANARLKENRTALCLKDIPPAVLFHYLQLV